MYYKNKILFLLAYLLFTTTIAQGQDAEDYIKAALSDTTKPAELTSDFVVRIDYYNKTLFAGRDYGVKQYSFTPSLTYNHKSGLSAAVSGYWYSATDPNYSMTDANLSYLNVFKFNENWSYGISYDHYFYNPSSSAILTNTVGVNTSYDIGHFNGGVSYNYSFGSNENGQNLSPSVGGFFEIKNVGFVKAITFAPTLSATFGTSNIAFTRFSSSQYAQGNGYTWDTNKKLRKTEESGLLKSYSAYVKTNPGTTFQAYLDGGGYQTGYQAYMVKHPNSKLTLNEYSAIVDGILAKQASSSKQEFGLMSWNFSLPVRFKIQKLTLGITYNYIIPVALSDESTTLSNQSYFSAMISYKFRK